MAARVMVRVESLVKRYGRVLAVDHVSFTVDEGEVFGLLGPNGAGKTTTLEILEGLRRPDGGRVEVAGHSVVDDPRAVRTVIGVQLQEAGFFDLLTVRETLETFAAFHRKGLPVDQVLERVGLRDRHRVLVRNLSGGQKQRLSIALALINDPRIVFLDEPTTGLDPQARRNLWEMIRQIRREGRTLILTTHSMEEAEALCDRVAIMDRGRLLALDRPDRLVAEHAPGAWIILELPYGLATPAAGLPVPNGGPEPGAEPLSDRLRRLPAVEAVSVPEPGGPTVLLRTRDATATLRGLSELQAAEGLAFRSLRVEQASLEDVFLQLTGRELRE
ncbi:MAG: ABC transporter ATP-binding protein [Bacillota bacterium]